MSQLLSDSQTEIARKVEPLRLLTIPHSNDLSVLSAVESASLPGLKQGNGSDLEGAVWDDVVARKSMIIQEALAVPKGFKKRAWVGIVGNKYGLHRSTVYDYIRKFEGKGLSGLRHTRSTKDRPKVWASEALKYWIGLVIKRAHRKISKRSLYEILRGEAERCGWEIGTYKNACRWVSKLVTPQLLALQNGGVRQLDNVLPPILRDYSDLKPFEILCGDQHIFDFWVVDEDTGEVIRPECYIWQDLRTRIIYGGAPARKYNSQLMGLALRIGVKFFGLFRSVYTDNGKPELSHYIDGIIEEIRNPDIKAGELLDFPLDLSGVDPEEIRCRISAPGRRTAIVKNAKAKIAEGLFAVIEMALRNQFRLPGYVKRLTDKSESQDIDQEEVGRLAESGKLLTWREFVVAFYNAIAWYNREKSHRGVLKEWQWRPKPKKATPIDCLNMCIRDGWQPTRLSDEAIDLIFLAKEPMSRTVDRGRIRFHNQIFENTNLVPLTGQKVDIRYDPLDLEWILIFQRGEYVCRAEPVEYSSMRDRDLAQRKIHEKAKLRKGYTQLYRELTSGIPDVRKFSEVPVIEKTAAIIGKDKRKKAIENCGLYRERTEDELSSEVVALEQKVQESIQTAKAERELPERPAYFLTGLDHYKWIVQQEVAGDIVLEQDRLFKAEYEARMDSGEWEYWETIRQLGVGG